MRIIDKNKDFYDYLQGVYRDDSVVFDRTDSFVLSREKMCDFVYSHSHYPLILLQVCNTFWLFFAETQRDSYGFVKDYDINFLSSWKDYNKPHKLIELTQIKIIHSLRISSYNKSSKRYERDKAKIWNEIDFIVSSIKNDEYIVERRMDKGVVSVCGTYVEKHIPILKASGLVIGINPLDIYLALEEYFSIKKTLSERTDSIGLTDKERIENHGFDTKISFRGK